jgi:hypothetical protein
MTAIGAMIAAVRPRDLCLTGNVEKVEQFFLNCKVADGTDSTKSDPGTPVTTAAWERLENWPSEVASWYNLDGVEASSQPTATSLAQLEDSIFQGVDSKHCPAVSEGAGTTEEQFGEPLVSCMVLWDQQPELQKHLATAEESLWDVSEEYSQSLDVEDSIPAMFKLFGQTRLSFLLGSQPVREATEL